MKSRKEKIQFISDYLNGKPLIDEKTIFLWIEGEETVEDLATGKVFRKKDVEHLCKIMSIDTREHLELIRKL